MQFRAAHTETLKAGCSPEHSKPPEANSSPADRHSRASARGDLSGSHERRRSGKKEQEEEEEKEQKRRRRKNDGGFESMAKRRFGAWRGFRRLTSISRRFPWSLFLLLRSMGNQMKHVHSCVKAKTLIGASALFDAGALLHSPGIKNRFKTTKIQKTCLHRGLSGPTTVKDLNAGG